MEKGQLTRRRNHRAPGLEDSAGFGCCPLSAWLYPVQRDSSTGRNKSIPNPNAVYAAPQKSLVELSETNAKESLAEFTAGARYRTPSAFDLKIVAIDYILLGDSIDADKWLTRSLQLNPTDSDGWYQLGRTKYNENRFTEAIEAFKKCLALDATNVKAEENLGLSYAGLGDDLDAAKGYQTAIDWQTTSVTQRCRNLSCLRYPSIGPKSSQGRNSIINSGHGNCPVGIPRSRITRQAVTFRPQELPKAQAELEAAVNLSPRHGSLALHSRPSLPKRGACGESKNGIRSLRGSAGSTSVVGPLIRSEELKAGRIIAMQCRT